MAFIGKFRVWDKAAKEFVGKGFSLTMEGKLLRMGQLVQNEDNFLIQPSTGMKDKYDKEIFEDDIIEHSLAKGGNITLEKGIVRYNKEQAAFYLDDIPLLQLFSIRKLGNPFENPILFDLHLKNKT